VTLELRISSDPHADVVHCQNWCPDDYSHLEPCSYECWWASISRWTAVEIAPVRQRPLTSLPI